jgi:hypothetical protein
MALYWLVRHLTTEQSRGGGTMIGYATHEAHDDEAAVQFFVEEYSISRERLTCNSSTNKEFSIVKLCPPQ